MSPKALEARAAIDGHVGDHPIKPGDRLEFTWRGDGLWNVTINQVHIDHAVDGVLINQLAAQKLVKEII
jgi:hypothetical protein